MPLVSRSVTPDPVSASLFLSAPGYASAATSVPGISPRLAQTAVTAPGSDDPILDVAPSVSQSRSGYAGARIYTSA